MHLPLEPTTSSSMGIVSGKLSCAGQQIPLYGLAELFMV